MQISYGQHVFVLVYPVAKRAESAARKTNGKEREKKLYKFDGTWRFSEHAHTHTNPQPNIQLWCTNTHHIKGEKRVLLPTQTEDLKLKMQNQRNNGKKDCHCEVL